MLPATYHGQPEGEIPDLPQVLRASIPQADTVVRAARNDVYLVVIGWMYVVLMMSVAEATNTTGSVLGAIVTFFLYGLLPVALVVYLMLTPQRRKAAKAREAAEFQAQQQAAASADPDAGGHAPGAAQAPGVAPVRKEP